MYFLIYLCRFHFPNQSPKLPQNTGEINAGSRLDRLEICCRTPQAGAIPSTPLQRRFVCGGKDHMKIDINNEDVAEFYEDLNSNADAIFLPEENFKKFISDVLSEPMIPPFMVAGEAILLRLRHLKKMAESLHLHVNRYRRTAAEGGFWVAELEPWNPPKGDIMNRGKRLGGSFGSKQ